MKNIFTPAWFRASAVRAVKTFAQSLLAALGIAQVFSEIDWLTALSTAALAAILSLLTSVAGLPEVSDGNH